MSLSTLVSNFGLVSLGCVPAAPISYRTFVPLLVAVEAEWPTSSPLDFISDQKLACSSSNLIMVFMKLLQTHYSGQIALYGVMYWARV